MVVRERPIYLFSVLAEVLRVLRTRWSWLLAGSLVSAVVAVGVALVIPQSWRSEALLVATSEPVNPYNNGSREALDRDMSFWGLEILRSPAFLADFARRHEIEVALLAGKRWRRQSAALELDSRVYDIQAAGWQPRRLAPDGRPPGDGELATALQERLGIDDNEDAYPLVRITMRAPAPDLAVSWLEKLIQDMNSEARGRQRLTTEYRYVHLKERMARLESFEIRWATEPYLWTTLSILTRVETEPDFAFRVLDPPSYPERTHGPSRPLIAILVASLGGCLSILIVLTLHPLRQVQ